MNLQLIEEDLSDAVHRGEPLAVRGATTGAIAAESSASIRSARGRIDADDGSAEHLSLLRSTQKEIRRLGSLVTDFLAYARPAAPRRTPHSLDGLVRDGVQLFEASARSSGVALSLDTRAGDAPILLDEAMLKQALMNVVVNALEAVAHPGGEVVVSTRRAGSTCEVVVADDGPGLPLDPESVFAVFHSTKKGGTGLGLAIARALVERQGGSLEARTAIPGPGAVFVISLPADAA
jgi:signal transduction histidine kinase